jgi:ATP-binding cassette subfamily B protein RaxB
LKTILQSQVAECGLACIAMVITAHGQSTSLADLRQRFPQSLKGSNLKQLMACSAVLGFSARPLRLELHELGQLVRPCILHWDMNHFVVLHKVGRKHVVVLDPAVGERRLSMDEVSRHFTGVALELTPQANFEPQVQSPRLKLSQLTGKVQGLGWSALQIMAVAVVLELFAIVAPLFNQLVVDDVLTSGDQELLTVLVWGFALVLVIQTVLSLARSWLVMVLGQTLSLQWLGNVFAHLVRLPVSWFEQRHLGDITSRFGAVHDIQKTLTNIMIEALLDGVMTLAALVMMFLYSSTLSGVVVAAAVVYGLVRWASFVPFRNAAAERLVLAGQEHSHFIESLRAMTPLKLFGREQERRTRWQSLMVEVMNRDIRTAKMNIGFTVINTFIFGVENLLVFWFGAKAILASQGPGSGTAVFTVGMLMAFISYKGQFTGRISALINHGIDLKMLGLHNERLADIALTPPEQDTPQGDLPEHDLSHLPPSLELKSVSFRYAEGEPWILKDAHLKIEAGENVAILGPSGCGKTTLLKLLLGLLQPVEGEVLYGGVLVRQLGLSNVRRKVGTVMQEDVLLTGSIADNISFFDMTPDMQRIEMCGQLAQLHTEIVRMPMGYQTLVGELGSGLSGGQKQRLLLARALYKRPSVLALDEATSHLDIQNEQAVNAVLAQLQLTRIVIAHRPETIASTQRQWALTPTGLLEVTAMQIESANA